MCDLIISDKLDGISCLYRSGWSVYTSPEETEKWAKHHTWPDTSGTFLSIFANQDIIVRELVILKKDFETLFSDDFANMRNLVAGCVSNVPKQKVAEQIIFVAYRHTPVK
jgi:hypothetical protein